MHSILPLMLATALLIAGIGVHETNDDLDQHELSETTDALSWSSFLNHTKTVLVAEGTTGLQVPGVGIALYERVGDGWRFLENKTLQTPGGLINATWEINSTSAELLAMVRGESPGASFERAFALDRTSGQAAPLPVVYAIDLAPTPLPPDANETEVSSGHDDLLALREANLTVYDNGTEYVPILSNLSLEPSSSPLFSGLAVNTGAPASDPFCADVENAHICPLQIAELQPVGDVLDQRVQISGKIVAKYGGGYPGSFPSVQPCAFCPVKIYDSDSVGLTGTYIPSEDDLLGTTTTTATGYFSKQVVSSDGLDNGVDPYVVVDMDRPNAKATSQREIASPLLRTDCPKTGGCSLGTWQVTGKWDAAYIWTWTSMVAALDRAHEAGMSTGFWPYVTFSIGWQTGSYYHEDDQAITIDIGDAFAPHVAMHELGHAIMHFAYGLGPFPSACGSVHYQLGSNTEYCAWDEGWATFFALWADETSYYKNSDGTTVDYERIHNLVHPCSSCTGAQYEALVAGTLWDVVDQNNYYDNSDPIYESVYILKEVLRDYGPQETIGEFHSDFKARWGPTAGNEFKSVAANNWIDVS